MKPDKRKRLEAAGWTVGDETSFLDLTPHEAAFIQVKLALSASVRDERVRRNWTQTTLANRLGSSQSRIAKLESGDRSVSLDLLVRALLTLGATPRDVGKVLTASKRTRAT